MPLAKHDAFPSAHVAPRHVHVWLPEGYDSDNAPYSVLYMHDGQNLFEEESATFGTTWSVPATMTSLLREGRVRKTIVVGVWCTPARFREYLPASVLQRLSNETSERLLGQEQYGGQALSDAYVRFLVDELKPFIDATYRTRPDVDSTFIMGSSMGGLISWYALASRPEVFGSAACLSTHWPLTIDESILSGEDAERWREEVLAAEKEALVESLPEPSGTRRLWFDFGTEHLDQHYEAYQTPIDVALEEIGYTRGQDWITRAYAGATHNEACWAARLAEPLIFLLGPS